MSSTRILVVDDEQAVRQILAEGLALAGYDCVESPGAADALEKVRAAEEQGRPFALVLSDIEMPGMSGTDLLKVLRHQYPGLDAVMITAVVDLDVALRAIRSGASDYLTKPFNVEQVRFIVERTLEKRRLIEQNRMYQAHLEAMVEDRTREVRDLYDRLRKTYHATLEALVEALDLRDNETQGHSLRVVEYTVELAGRLGVDSGELEEIRRGALLHDIGKIGISDTILSKPAKLTPEEWKYMRRHPELGHQILYGIPFLEAPREIVLCHQEKYDGTGYPRGLKGDEIPLGARIFAVADTYDAMTSKRPYRDGLPYEIARQEIIDYCGTQFDPRVVAAFLEVPRERWMLIRRDVERRLEEREARRLASQHA